FPRNRSPRLVAPKLRSSPKQLAFLPRKGAGWRAVRLGTIFSSNRERCAAYPNACDHPRRSRSTTRHCSGRRNMRPSKTMLAAVLLLGMLPGCGYNRIQELDERAEQQRSNVEVELVNRNNLIPNLVATVEGAADFERGTFTEVAQAR